MVWFSVTHELTHGLVLHLKWLLDYVAIEKSFGKACFSFGLFLAKANTNYFCILMVFLGLSFTS